MPRFDRLTAIVTLIVIPVAVPWLGSAIIDAQFAQGGTYRAGSSIEVHDWWTSPLGYPLVGAILAGLFAAFRPHRFGVILGVAAAAGLLTGLAPIAAFLLFILLGGDPGWQ